MSSLEELFCSVDDFCQQFEPQWRQSLLSHGLKTRVCKRALCRWDTLVLNAPVVLSEDLFRDLHRHQFHRCH